MELELTEEQAEFVATTRRFLAAECPTSNTRALEHDPAGFDPSIWQRSAELGWTSLLVSEALGGGSLSDHGLSDLVLVAEEMGRVVAPGPLVAVNVVADALSRHGTAEQQREVLPSLLDGTAVAAWCGPGPVSTRRESGRIVLSGRCAPVEAAAQAAHLLVTATVDDRPAQLLVPADTPGLTVTALDGLDLVRRFAAVEFADVDVGDDALLGGARPATDATPAIERQERIACVLQSAETVGAIDRVFEMTLEYLGDRYSFGRALSSYQALKHRMADHKTVLEACHAIAGAAARATAADRPDAPEMVAAAGAWIGPHATEMIQDCIQLHGGIGVTWEHDLHLYLRRVTVNRAHHGTPEQHLDRLATRLLGATA